MSELNLALALIGATVLVLGFLSEAIERWPLSAPLLATAVGVAIGPAGLGLLDPASWWGEIGAGGERFLEQAARLTLAVSLMGVALRLKRDDVARLARPVLVLLGPGMLVMWGVGAGLAGLILGLPFWLALLVGAVVTPTDPVVASSIVTGPLAEDRLSDRTRDTLSFESGANDGLAYPLVFLAILMLAHPPGEALSIWAVDKVLVGIVLAAPIGLALGAAAAWITRAADRAGVMDPPSLLTTTIALSLATLGAAKLAGSDALVSVFAAGLAFNLCADLAEAKEDERVQEAIVKLFTRPIFVLFGLVLPWAAWAERPWTFAAFALALLLLRRPGALFVVSPLLLSYPREDRIFFGWFGPVGVAALFYAMLSLHRTGEAVVWHAAAAAILLSVVLHGVTAAAGVRWRARR
jgi:NhaP-type Na+/H+ or K+/H+ antiporter